mmetsp:Transcript_949/g.2717  ORF Transcript_949/g.2717 Transcript_949/m.2717 type:complete len:422 (-) Transcript_949:295-1560(-)
MGEHVQIGTLGPLKVWRTTDDKLADGHYAEPAFRCGWVFFGHGMEQGLPWVKANLGVQPSEKVTEEPVFFAPGLNTPLCAYDFGDVNVKDSFAPKAVQRNAFQAEAWRAPVINLNNGSNINNGDVELEILGKIVTLEASQVDWLDIFVERAVGRHDRRVEQVEEIFKETFSKFMDVLPKHCAFPFNVASDKVRDLYESFTDATGFASLFKAVRAVADEANRKIGETMARLIKHAVRHNQSLTLCTYSESSIVLGVILPQVYADLEEELGCPPDTSKITLITAGNGWKGYQDKLLWRLVHLYAREDPIPKYIGEYAPHDDPKIFYDKASFSVHACCDLPTLEGVEAHNLTLLVDAIAQCAARAGANTFPEIYDYACAGKEIPLPDAKETLKIAIEAKEKFFKKHPDQEKQDFIQWAAWVEKA